MPERRLQAENLHLWRGDRHVLRGLRFSLRAGECLQVRGPNGAGKTSLLRTLSGLSYPEEGRIYWEGEDIHRDLLGYQAEIAYIGHESPLKVDLTPLENLRYWIGLRRRVPHQELHTALARTNAEQYMDRPVRTLSAGQKRRVALAGLLLLAVPLWLLDEPTTNLDAEGQQLVGALLDEHLRAGGLVVTAIHHELAVGRAVLKTLELPGS